MKKLIFFIALIFAFSITVEAKTTKTNETVKYTYFDITDDIMQDADVTQTSRNENNSKGQLLYNIASGRYYAGFETSRYSEDKFVNKQAIEYTNCKEIQPSYINLTQDWERNRSRMHLRRAGTGSQDIQGNYYDTEGNYNNSKGNNYHPSKSVESISEDLLLYWIGCWNWHSNYDSQVFYETKNTTSRLGAIPELFFIDITKTNSIYHG